MPAAAVIPAPRAYTNIAAVKTLVVGCWAQVCWAAAATGVEDPKRLFGARGGSLPNAADSTPSGMFLRPLVSRTVRPAPAPSLLQWGPTRHVHGTLART